jgi:hypothetical protein
MRFHAKFGLLGWLWVVVASVCTINWFVDFGRHSTLESFSDLGPVLILLLTIYDCVFNYLELNSDGLSQRHFWGKKEVAWDKVTHVGDYTLWGLPSEYLEVDYDRPTTKSGHGRILANPADREKFIRELRQFAPEATFTV